MTIDSMQIFVANLTECAYGVKTVFGRIGKAAQPTRSSDRRDIFPLPRVSQHLLNDLTQAGAGRAELTAEARLGFVNLTIDALNVLNGHRKPTAPSMAPPRAAQRACLGHVLDKCLALLDRLFAKMDGARRDHFMEVYEPPSQPPRPVLDAEQVDIPTTAGTCDPMEIVARPLRERLENPSAIFPSCPIGVGSVTMSQALMPQYLAFTGRIVLAGKVELLTTPSGVASFFVVGKPGKDRLRPIWGGDKISEACERPPKPRRLGNPISFVDIRVSPGETLFFSKRDAETYFDTLKAPQAVRHCICYPPVRLGELCDSMGCT